MNQSETLVSKADIKGQGLMMYVLDADATSNIYNIKYWACIYAVVRGIFFLAGV